MSSQLNRMVPLFDGSNYCTWATNMTAFLRSQCLWGIVAQLAIPAPSQNEVNERQKEQREWTEKDEQALGHDSA